MKLYLASTSKFKSDILDTTHLFHESIASDYEEVSNKDNVYEYVKELALGKVKSIEKKVSDGIILGLDTVVYINGKILEKPKSLEEAKKVIKYCQNKTTKVITGIALINKKNNEIINDFVETKVTLRKISNKDINYYIENEPNILNVSGFVLETIISNFIEKIEGSYYNILGIPVETIYKYLNNWEIYLSDLEK